MVNLDFRWNKTHCGPEPISHTTTLTTTGGTATMTGIPMFGLCAIFGRANALIFSGLLLIKSQPINYYISLLQETIPFSYSTGWGTSDEDSTGCVFELSKATNPEALLDQKACVRHCLVDMVRTRRIFHIDQYHIKSSDNVTFAGIAQIEYLDTNGMLQEINVGISGIVTLEQSSLLFFKTQTDLYSFNGNLHATLV